MHRSGLIGFAIVAALTMALAMGLSACENNLSEKRSAKGPKSGMAKSGGQSLPSQHLGKPFDVKEVTALAKVMSNPKAFKGKKIHVKGLVVAHCHHQLAWFAMAKDKDSRVKLRVWTKHEFLVPKGVRHGATLAEAEGVVEIQTIPENKAKHYARDHGLFGGDASKISGPQFLPSLRVTGAKFQL
jgi:hypothetical protein